MTLTTWTDERVSTLRQLWTDGLPAREIAAQLAGVTRNAVLGKLHRLGLLGGRPKDPVVKPRRPAASRPPRPKGVPSPPRRPPASDRGRSPAPDWPGEVDRLEGLGPHHCRWPIGDPRAGGFSFCGRRAAAGPYCPAHRAVAYVARAAGARGAAAA